MKKLLLVACLSFCFFFFSSGQSFAAVHPNRWWSYGNNSWGYTMQPISGHFIHFIPQPSDSRRYFCVVGIFDCIPNFWFGYGYVEQCFDGQFDKLGGTRYACQNHRGVWRILYWQ